MSLISTIFLGWFMSKSCLTIAGHETLCWVDHVFFSILNQEMCFHICFELSVIQKHVWKHISTQGDLRWDPSTMRLLLKWVALFLGRAFVAPKPLRGWLSLFGWLAALGKILTIDNLRKKNMVLINKCGMCKRNEESIDHLLLHCEGARVLWNAFFSCFGLAWSMPRGVVNLLQCWWLGGRSCSVVVWKMVPHCIMWCLWSEWNKRYFDDSKSS